MHHRSAAGHEAYERWLFVKPGEVRDLGDVRLDLATTIKGRLIGTYTLSIRDGIRVVHTRDITVGSSPLRVRASC